MKDMVRLIAKNQQQQHNCMKLFSALFLNRKKRIKNEITILNRGRHKFGLLNVIVRQADERFNYRVALILIINNSSITRRKIFFLKICFLNTC